MDARFITATPACVAINLRLRKSEIVCGLHERFIGFLIEHYAGNFPLWLAPDQVRVITLNDDEALINYAKPHRGRTPREHSARGLGFQRVFLALAAFGFYTSQAGRPIFHDAPSVRSPK
jgi:hypothetical protein